jgi:hypothetical protein
MKCAKALRISMCLMSLTNCMTPLHILYVYEMNCQTLAMQCKLLNAKN